MPLMGTDTDLRAWYPGLPNLTEAKFLELRAAMSLVRLWQQQGKRAAVRDLLAPVHSWCTEGFDAADLQEAKVLVDELA